MAAKRPSYVSIRARQRRILDYRLSTGKSNKETAKEFGVTPGQLKKFVDSNPKKLRKSYNLNKTTKKLYAEAEPKQVRRMVRMEKVPYVRTTTQLSGDYLHREFTVSPQAGERYYEVASKVEYLYAWEVSPKLAESHAWEIYTDERDLPRSIDAIRSMWQRGELSDEEWDDIHDAWEETYNIEAAGAA